MNRHLYCCRSLLALAAVAVAFVSSWALAEESANPLLKPGTKAGDRAVMTLDGVDYAFRWAPAGSFMMGSPEDEVDRDASEVLHKVTLTRGFWILETETTQEMWSSVMGSNPSKFEGKGKPVDTVSHSDANEYCAQLSKKANLPEGALFALPTEAQWEYVARAGETGAIDLASLDKSAWYGDQDYNGTHVVGTKAANAWGVYDMLGNLWEWTADKLGNIEKDADGVALPVVDPTGATDEETPANIRVDRGGCWDSHDYECRYGYRGFYDGDRKGPYVGFRFVLIPQ